MCGIFFQLSKKKQINIKQSLSSLNILKRRGPNFSFYKLINNKIFLGQTTLSITTNKNENIENFHISKSGRFYLLFNGEIYNYNDLKKELTEKFNIKFASNSDTELFSALFDYYSAEEIINKIKGMYAFVIYDTERKEVFTSRDHIGEKILYYYDDDEYFIISSEIKPMLELGINTKIEKNSLREYFYTRHFLTVDNTCFKNIKTIRSGKLYKYQVLNNNFDMIYNHSFTKNINEDKYNKILKKNENNILSDFKNLMNKSSIDISPSISYHSICSGGIDSSLVSALISKNDNQPKKYISLDFSSKDKSFLNITELEKSLNINVDKYNITEDMYSNVMNKVYKYNCAPLATHSFISQFFVSKINKESNSKVLLTGDGADELFGGYTAYLNFDKVIKNLELTPSPYSGINKGIIKFNNFKNERLRNELKNIWKFSLKQYDFIKNKQEKILQAVLLMDTYVQLESVGIRSSDIMSMIHSTEARSLFLMQDVVNYAINLPIKYKLNTENKNVNMKGKYILKQLLINLCKNNKSVIVKKEGFSGFPNEAGKKIIKKDEFNLTKDFLEIKNYNHEEVSNNQALEWKFINTEIFLKNFNNYM